MALFGKNRDINLFHTINSELLKDIIQTEVAYYKFALEQTTSNVYGESTGKNYYEPMKVACLINKDDQSWSSDDFGSDINQGVNFSFLKDDLKDINLKPEVEYTKLNIKFITRGDAGTDIEKFKEEILTSDRSKNDLRIPGVKTIKFNPNSLKRL